MKNNNLGIFLQARMGSTRLPGKIFELISGKTALKMLVDNIKKTEFGDNLYVLTSINSTDDVVEKFAKRENLKYFRGSEKDVLDRFYQAAIKFKIFDILRLTGDCPFLSMKVLTDNIDQYYNHMRPDYYWVNGYPRGLGDAELFTFEALSMSYKLTAKQHYREHVVTYILDHPDKFKVVVEKAPAKYRRSNIRLTLDEQADLDLLRAVASKLNGKTDLDSIIELFNKEPGLVLINKRVRQKIV